MALAIGAMIRQLAGIAAVAHAEFRIIEHLHQRQTDFFLRVPGENAAIDVGFGALRQRVRSAWPPLSMVATQVVRIVEL